MALSHYRALLVQDTGDGPDSGYGVVFPDIPGCTSAGETQQAAVRHATDALASHLGLLVEDGDSLPEASELGSPLPEWLDDAGQIVGEVLVPTELPEHATQANIPRHEALSQRAR